MAIVAAIDPTEGRRKLADPVLPKAPPATNPSPMAAGLVAVEPHCRPGRCRAQPGSNGRADPHQTIGCRQR
jgi:hypothetical protein